MLNEYHTLGWRTVPFVTPRRAASMSALGQKQTLLKVCDKSALPPNADIDRWHREVCLVKLPAKSQNTALRKNPRSGSRGRHMSCLPGVRDHNEISIRYVFAFLFSPASIFIYQICRSPRRPVPAARLSPRNANAGRCNIARNARGVSRLAPANCHDSLFYRSIA